MSVCACGGHRDHQGFLLLVIHGHGQAGCKLLPNVVSVLAMMEAAAAPKRPDQVPPATLQRLVMPWCMTYL